VDGVGDERGAAGQGAIRCREPGASPPAALPVAAWTVTATAFARRPAGPVRQGRTVWTGPAPGGNGVVMLSDAYPECGGRAPPTLGGSAVSIHLDVDDVDAFFHKAVAAGATECKPVMDQLYGDRSGQREDPFGHLW
jgi:hypothetical protein